VYGAVHQLFSHGEQVKDKVGSSPQILGLPPLAQSSAPRGPVFGRTLTQSPPAAARSPPKLYSYAAQPIEPGLWRRFPSLLRRVFRAAGGDTSFWSGADLPTFSLCAETGRGYNCSEKCNNYEDCSCYYRRRRIERHCRRRCIRSSTQSTRS